MPTMFYERLDKLTSDLNQGVINMKVYEEQRQQLERDINKYYANDKIEQTVYQELTQRVRDARIEIEASLDDEDTGGGFEEIDLDEDTGFDLDDIQEISPQTDPRIVEVGDRLRRYLVVEFISSGGMSILYRAKIWNDEKGEDFYVLKFPQPHIQAHSVFFENFIKMGRELKELPEHPHIPKFFGLVGRSKGNSKAWVREYIDGISLQQHLKKGPVTIQKALQVISQIGSVLDVLHKNRWIHRDIKPSNILVSRHEGHWKIIDFDLAFQMDSDFPSKEDTPAGTVKYMSPEQFLKKPQAASDRYALGMLTYVLIAGEYPFSSTLSDEEIKGIKWSEKYTQLYKKIPSVNPVFSAVISRMLSADPTARYDSCTLYVEALRNALTSIEEEEKEKTIEEKDKKSKESERKTLIKKIEDIHNFNKRRDTERESRKRTEKYSEYYDKIEERERTLEPVRRKLDGLQKAISELEGAKDRYKRISEYIELKKEIAGILRQYHIWELAPLQKQLFETPKGTIFQMVLLPAGRYERGSFSGSVASALEMPPHDVDITNGFWMLTTPVTQELYSDIMFSNPSMVVDPKNPVTNVTWSDAVRFCNTLSQKLHFTPIYKPTYGRQRGFELHRKGNGFRLPTEAEWEYAALAPKRGVGEFEYAGSNQAEEVAWFLANSDDTIHPVKQKKANAFHMYDMCGNVEEWCQDWFAEYSEREVYDPIGPWQGENKVTRGGSYRGEHEAIRIKSRDFNHPQTLFPYLGFRFVHPVQKR